MNTEDEHAEAAAQLVALLKGLQTDGDRTEVLAIVNASFCFRCGRREPSRGRPCRCWCTLRRIEKR